ncbi:diguanylate cyclase [Pseudoteredinibacter isoporae]|uniref:diguanylate cyclase n=1 Tax=Pseudoteredinibacter isoporae TaxID=570281 RepID=UPI003105EBF1
MKKILIIEDSNTVMKVLRYFVNLESDFIGLYAQSYSEAKAIVERESEQIFAALVDLHLPDAEDGEVVDYTLSKKIPTIVLTSSFNEERRKHLFSKGIIDYVTKEGQFSYRYAIGLLNRIWRNQQVKVLVAEDSNTSRRYISDLLRLYLFQVYTAVDGQDAIDILMQQNDIKMLITDYHMPNMDGVSLVRNLRNKYEKSDLVIIGLSGQGEEALSAKFIKNGANDFLHKPFNREEFQCRVMHNIEAMEHLEQARNVANRDFLTGAYNRRYFFTNASCVHKQAKTENTPLAVAVLDIDFFKKINDNYGHDVGDGVLKFFSKALNEALERFLVARAGGEEFFVLMPGLNNQQACTLMDKVRDLISKSAIEIGQNTLTISFSTGISNLYMDSIDAQLKVADQALYRAKESGRNCVIGDVIEHEAMLESH